MRAAEASDIPAILALVESGFRGESAKRGWTHEADLLGGQRTDAQAVGEMIADPRQTMLLLEEGGALRGCVSIADKGAGRAYLGMLTVSPDLQGAGLGRKLVDGAEHFARTELGARVMEM
ncbi:MAG TPA: GNAT family N-acetyltransferase, partial [Terricaulis sp.]|nr:GNAT family N-acetyltransferase [Terricaulis sp.]